MKARLYIACALATALLPVAVPAGVVAQTTGPQIRFLNPSGYSATPTLSDKSDADNTYHLVAWVRSVPPNPFVEFELTSATVGTITVDASRVGSDTWEANLSIAGLTDGQYTLRALLYRDFTGAGTGTQVDQHEMTVTVNRANVPPPPAANTVEMSIPANGGAMRYFSPKGQLSNALVEGQASEDTAQVRVLYTTSAPGTDAVWTQCGTGAPASDLSVLVRCTFDEGVNAVNVSAVAMVANDTPPPATASPLGDASGDAHRVTPVAQVPTSVSVSPSAVTAETSACQVLEATVLDQAGRPIAAVNVDIHATGPDDQVRFGSVANTTGAFQAPDSGHVAFRPAINCANRNNSGTQGDHNIPGANDPQHIESVNGTGNRGRFTFALYSETTGTTQVVAWADVNDDDALQLSEASGGGRVGWGGPPAPPTVSLLMEPRSSSATTGTCQRVTLAAREGGNAMSGANVDVHITGPASSVAFCVPPGGSVGRAPDQGGHVGNADDEMTRHLEGETDSAGNFTFGVSSPQEGTTEVLAWIDTTDDDVRGAGEVAESGQVSWAVSGDRTISIQSNRKRVPKGRRVRISGSVDAASPTCEGGQLVRLRAKPVSGGKFRTIGKKASNDDGSYRFRPRVRKAMRYRTVAPPSGVCERARSRVIRVRTR